MKLQKHSLAFFLSIFLLGISNFIDGCATTGINRSVKTSN